MWPAVLRIGFKQLVGRLSNLRGGFLPDWQRQICRDRTAQSLESLADLSAGVFLFGMFAACPFRQSVGLHQIGFFQNFSLLGIHNQRVLVSGLKSDSPR